MKYCDVILPVPFEAFTYALPEEMAQRVVVGSRVLVELGKSKKYAGVVMRVHSEDPRQQSGKAGVVVKQVLDVLDERPIVRPEQLKLWRWVADYYLSPFGDVYKAAFPGEMKKDETHPETERTRRAAERRMAYLEGASEGDGITRQLSDAQQKTFDEIVGFWENTPQKPITLLHGVTSSGKTEVYIHLIQKCLDEGKQVLYLLPEIALTTQITNRLRRVFGSRLGVYHSKFSDRDRTLIYRRQLGEQPFDVILGVRSSVFLPFQRLGLVIVDEEHEMSYKQQDPAPRYHARSVAIMLARQFGAFTLLGTATPSIETYRLAQAGSYGYVRLDKRYADIELPDIEVVDVKRLKFQKLMKGAFSPRLIEEIGGALERKEQVILFQNRRGYSSFVQCRDCGWVPRCSHCDVSLTFHKKTNALVCHYCGSTYTLPEICPQCSAETTDAALKDKEKKRPVFTTIGLGTERIEDQLHQLFPQARVSRMDLDTAKSRTQYERIIEEFSCRQSDILVGTQMVTKGLDFDNVSVVGVIDADTMLNQADFRAYERSFQMIAQVAGRAGRKNHKGKVLLQTRSADLPLIDYVVRNDYDAMYEEQLQERELFKYPPFHRLIYVFMRHRDNDVLEHLAQDMAQKLRLSFGERVYGPDRPPVGRVQSLHIRKIMLKLETSLSPSAVRQALRTIQQQMLAMPYANGLGVYYDVDPL